MEFAGIKAVYAQFLVNSMKPKKQERSPCDDFFRLRLKKMLAHRHELYRLTREIDWLMVTERFGGFCIQRKTD